MVVFRYVICIPMTAVLIQIPAFFKSGKSPKLDARYRSPFPFILYGVAPPKLHLTFFLFSFLARFCKIFSTFTCTVELSADKRRTPNKYQAMFLENWSSLSLFASAESSITRTTKSDTKSTIAQRIKKKIKVNIFISRQYILV